jgi:hypothetical protein
MAGTETKLCVRRVEVMGNEFILTLLSGDKMLLGIYVILSEFSLLYRNDNKHRMSLTRMRSHIYGECMTEKDHGTYQSLKPHHLSQPHGKRERQLKLAQRQKSEHLIYQLVVFESNG